MFTSEPFSSETSTRAWVWPPTGSANGSHLACCWKLPKWIVKPGRVRQGSEVYLLPGGLLYVAWSSLNPSREVVDMRDVVLR
jgi:hypothetical protein